MRHAAIALAAAALAICAATASAQMGHDGHGMDDSALSTIGVSMSVSAYSPSTIEVLVGDTVRWSNDSIRAHTVSADDGSWSSAQIPSTDSFTHRFDAAGSVAYYCKLHVFMRGVVNVRRILLDAPREPGAPGRAYALRGRAALPAGTPVTIEADTGAGFQPAAQTTVDADGTFATDVVAQTSATYRAVSGSDTSTPAQLLVLDRKLAASGRTRGRRVTVSASVAPASPGATVVLQLRLKERFGWWPVARAKVDHHSRASFRLRLGHRYRARVVLTLSDGATQLALSRTLQVGLRHSASRRTVHHPQGALTRFSASA
jgi:plastocyanin